ncbi:hypothetical protein [Streptomyces sp. NPDC058583]|uniref:virginiamycin B lyase family protein n=1 Tax=unclassified Streptomyces TaxID=2593676 RepID=UPI003666149F
MTFPAIEEYAESGRDSGPYAITTGPDGALWFTEIAAGQIGRMAPRGTTTTRTTGTRTAITTKHAEQRNAS